MFKPSNPRSIKQLSTEKKAGSGAAPSKRAGGTGKKGEGISEKRLKIRWTRRSGIRGMTKAIPSEPASGAPEEVATKFLSQNRQLLGIEREVGELKVAEFIESKGISHIRFQQVYQGLPVYGAEISVHVDNANQVQVVNGEYLTDLTLPRSIREKGPITKVQAIETAIHDLGEDTTLRGSATAEMIIYPVRDQYVKAYKVTFSTSMPLGDWVYFINAENGKVIDSYNAMRFILPQGSVYNSNPKQDPTVLTVELNRLDGSGKLQGTFAHIDNAAGEEAYSKDGQFIYKPGDSHFDEVMAYFHVDKVHIYFSNLGFDGLKDPMKANVHVPDPETKDPDYDNAFYSPEDNQLYFGHGKELNDLAKESAVIYHEYTHAVIDSIRPEIEGTEGSALHEGYADYFGCSITDDPLIGEYAVEKIGEKYFRDLTSNKKYPKDIQGEEHTDGEIWGSSCWDLRELLGARVADFLIYQSLYYLPKKPEFVDAYEGISQADLAHFNGVHLPQIEKIFSYRGIAPAVPQPPSEPPPKPKEQKMAIRGNQAWTNTGITVKKGQDISISATGTIIYDNKGSSCSPDGASWSDTKDKEDPIFTKPHGGLIGRLGITGNPFFIGSKYKARVDTDGVLYLGINDKWYKGNTGQFTITIKY
jgi:Zn-dependent metalloprotease